MKVPEALLIPHCDLVLFFQKLFFERVFTALPRGVRTVRRTIADGCLYLAVTNVHCVLLAIRSLFSRECRPTTHLDEPIQHNLTITITTRVFSLWLPLFALNTHVVCGWECVKIATASSLYKICVMIK